MLNLQISVTLRLPCRINRNYSQLYNAVYLDTQKQTAQKQIQTEDDVIMSGDAGVGEAMVGNHSVEDCC